MFKDQTLGPGSAKVGQPVSNGMRLSLQSPAAGRPRRCLHSGSVWRGILSQSTFQAAVEWQCVSPAPQTNVGLLLLTG